MRKSIIIALLAILVVSGVAVSQTKLPKRKAPRKSPDQTFLETQFWIGFKGGVNWSKANPTESYSTFSPIDYSLANLDKEYQDFEDVGSQFGLEFTFYHKGFSISFQPSYARFNFGYLSHYEYFDSEQPDNTLTLDYQQDQHLQYLDLPVLIKYDILKGRLRPFVQIGAYYSLLLNAQKELSISGTDNASGGVAPFQRPSFSVGAKDLFNTGLYGVMGGIGASYDRWNIRLQLDVNYRYGLNNITNESNRYTENRLAGSGDAMDDMTLDNIQVNLGVLFPLRFISKNYNTVSKKKR